MAGPAFTLREEVFTGIHIVLQESSLIKEYPNIISKDYSTWQSKKLARKVKETYCYTYTDIEKEFGYA